MINEKKYEYLKKISKKEKWITKDRILTNEELDCIDKMVKGLKGVLL